MICMGLALKRGIFPEQPGPQISTHTTLHGIKIVYYIHFLSREYNALKGKVSRVH